MERGVQESGMNENTIKLMTSSVTPEWYTPIDFYRKLDDRFHFTTDPAADPTNRLGCKIFFTEETDGLANIDKWQGNVFCNPPYSRQMTKWIEACSNYSRNNPPNKAVMLVPARTDTRWFHNYIWKKPGVEIEFIKGRIAFDPGPEYRKTHVVKKVAALFPSMIIIFGDKS